MRLPCLDSRLQAAYDFVLPDSIHADVASDHGLLPLRLVVDGKCPRVIVSDINAAALGRAKAAFCKYGYHHQADFVHADGLECLTEPVQSVSITGLGGDKLCGILERGAALLRGAPLILSPHSRLYTARRGIYAAGYHITQEKLVRSRGRYYIMMFAEEGASRCDESGLWLGPCLIHDRRPLCHEYLLWREKVAVSSGGEDLPYIKEALSCW